MAQQTQPVKWGWVLIAGILLRSVSIGAARAQREARSTVARDSMDHGPLTNVLDRFVDARGNVDLARLKSVSDSVLGPYL